MASRRAFAMCPRPVLTARFSPFRHIRPLISLYLRAEPRLTGGAHSAYPLRARASRRRLDSKKRAANGHLHCLPPPSHLLSHPASLCSFFPSPPAPYIPSLPPSLSSSSLSASFPRFLPPSFLFPPPQRDALQCLLGSLGGGQQSQQQTLLGSLGGASAVSGVVVYLQPAVQCYSGIRADGVVRRAGVGEDPRAAGARPTARLLQDSSATSALTAQQDQRAGEVEGGDYM
ncbi:unnamed protein product [Closterium sp. NIES-64]|nr:unnamed protein product [Closterium sp. NIES-64]CAI5958072.1 unnamed protein product [Closterium sp. NIES-64]